MSDGTDTSRNLEREKPWFERHIRIVLGALSALLLAVIWVTSAISDADRRVEAPLLAEGAPPVPVQATEPVSANRPNRQDSTEASANQAQPVENSRTAHRDTRRPPRQKPAASSESGASGSVSGRPLVVDAATLIFGQTAICVDGIVGAKDLARQVNQYLGTESLICNVVRPGHFKCLRKSDSKDFAQLMVAEGFARAVDPNGPLALSEEFAKAGRRGIWQQNVPPTTSNCSAS